MSISVTTLDEAFKEWMIWRRDNGTNSKTLKKNNNDYNNYVKGSPICSMKVASLTITNFEDFFYELTKGYAITSKRLSNIKSVLNGIMKRCVSREIIAHNILSDVDMQIFHKRCKPAASNKDNYSEAERQQILDYLSDKTDPYAMAIKLALYLPLRISEICNHLGIRYRSSHQIRFTVATLLFSKGVPITELSTLLGNADTAITWHYIRKQETTDDTLLKMQAVLG